MLRDIPQASISFLQLQQWVNDNKKAIKKVLDKEDTQRYDQIFPNLQCSQFNIKMTVELLDMKGMQKGETLLRNIYRAAISPQGLHEWEIANKDAIDKALGNEDGKLLQEEPRYCKFDITMMAKLLSLKTTLTKTITVKQTECVTRLRDLRNNRIAHGPRPAFSKEEFRQIWQEAEEIMLGLGGDQDQINHIKEGNYEGLDG